MCRLQLVAALVLTLAVSSTTSSGLMGPAHASCHADWTFGVACSEAMQKMIDQMNAWSGPEGCADGGEKCLYEYISTEGNVVKAKHTTPVHMYVDDLTLTFEDAQDGTCILHGFSTSETWYAHLDFGTNFCNMKNLITGSGLDTVQGYSETADDDTCTQYSSADCDKY